MPAVSEVTWMPTMQLGGGYNAASCTAHNTPFAVHELKTLPEPVARTDFALELIESSRDYLASLDVSVQASMEMGGYTGEASASYAREQSINSSSVFLVASVKVVHAVNQLTPDTVSALTLAAAVREQYASHPELFLDHYGDHFVSGVVLGGEFVATVVIATSSKADKQKVTMAAKAGGAGAGAKFSGAASFAGALNAATKDRRVTVRVLKIGGSALHVKDLSSEEFLQMAGAFPDEIVKAPVPRAAHITPYEELTDLATLQEGRADVLEEIQWLGTRYVEYTDARNDLEYMQFHKQEYLPVPDAGSLAASIQSVEDQRAKVRSQVHVVVGQWQRSGEVPIHAPFPPAADLTRGLPVRLDSLPHTAGEVAQALRISGVEVTAASDGEYSVFLDSEDIASRVTLYCHGLSGPNPATYITLRSGAPDANTSTWATSPTGRWRSAEAGDLVTKFDRIRFDPISRTVDPTDTTFAHSRSYLWEHNSHGQLVREYAAASYGIASASNHIPDAKSQPRTPFGWANVDLRGTGFRIADGVKWEASGFDVKTRKGQTGEPTEGRHTVTVSVGGAPGWILPKPALQLDLDR